MTLNHTRPAATQFAPIRRLDIASEKRASWPVTNGLGVLDLLHDIWLDSTWWLLESTADRFAVLADGLLTMMHVGRGRDATGQPRGQLCHARRAAAHQPAGAPGRGGRPLDIPAVLRDGSLAHPAEREAFKQTLLGQ